MFTFSQKDIHVHDASRSLPSPASRIAMLDWVQRNIGQDLIPRELRAFCHLCPLDAPAVTELCKLNKHDLVQWGKKCSEAADEWCSFSWNSEVNTEKVSNPTEFSSQVRSFVPLLLYPSSKKQPLNYRPKGQITRHTLRRHQAINQNLSCHSHPSFSTVPTILFRGSPRNVLGQKKKRKSI